MSFRNTATAFTSTILQKICHRDALDVDHLVSNQLNLDMRYQRNHDLLLLGAVLLALRLVFSAIPSTHEGDAPKKK